MRLLAMSPTSSIRSEFCMQANPICFCTISLFRYLVRSLTGSFSSAGSWCWLYTAFLISPSISEMSWCTILAPPSDIESLLSSSRLSFLSLASKRSNSDRILSASFSPLSLCVYSSSGYFAFTLCTKFHIVRPTNTSCLTSRYVSNLSVPFRAVLNRAKSFSNCMFFVLLIPVLLPPRTFMESWHSWSTPRTTPVASVGSGNLLVKYEFMPGLSVAEYQVNAVRAK
mmetsp:Transcript_53470/g.120495  ORF Transcript_53470/g.120495 Transcript_53470/m.120495 type:complete len:226 (-) Transcript_53470:278-955(-)